jgi:hypothetical protein
MRNKWFEKLIGCAFHLDERYTTDIGEYIYNGNYFAEDGKMQYEFVAEGKPQVLLTYKEARLIMGVMNARHK